MCRNDSRDAEARIEPKSGKKSEPIAADASILIASVSLLHLTITYSESVLIVILVAGSKLRGFEDNREPTLNRDLHIP
jgi:hypothetical protein